MATVTLIILLIAIIAVSGKVVNPVPHRFPFAKLETITAREDLPEELQEELARGEFCDLKLGCFSDTAPYNEPSSERPSYTVYLPDTAENIAPEFRFFCPGHTDTPQKIMTSSFDAWKVADSGFDASAKTVFIIHGYMGGNADWPLRMKDALINKEKCNVFVVDWSDGSSPSVWRYGVFTYEKAVANTRMIGAEVGLFIKQLMDATKIDPKLIHVVGHSLGAHVSGYAGEWVLRNETKLIGRITGLDPAGPLFNGVHPLVRLGREDAEFVDVIHTNYAPNRFEGYGIKETLGHFDFYPNGGEDQTGCVTASDAYLSFSVNALTCSHSRAYELFTASIEEPECKFKSVQCENLDQVANSTCGTCEENCVSMGYYSVNSKDLAQKDSSIIFYLKTTGEDPYCLEKQAQT
ncbi:pancreatic triacylglycerol lipase-like [Stegodyphus dumicola]|uniref:pancreatic triacylglycerol lipase-like n=1 Tax=Stegodyphus dumicola TaxID=202533 RepID=UPI0015B36F61|nr:pancreatic triacylglycerol lipase-like [Stegodyphus dumicola]